MTRIPLGSSTPEGVAKDLRLFAEMTARNSQNWDNYEALVLDVLQQVKTHYEKLLAGAKRPATGSIQDEDGNAGNLK